MRFLVIVPKEKREIYVPIFEYLRFHYGLFNEQFEIVSLIKGETQEDFIKRCCDVEKMLLTKANYEGHIIVFMAPDISSVYENIKSEIFYQQALELGKEKNLLFGQLPPNNSEIQLDSELAPYLQPIVTVKEASFEGFTDAINDINELGYKTPEIRVQETPRVNVFDDSPVQYYYPKTDGGSRTL